MKLTINGEELILPKDFEFRIEQHHPFFSDEGASTVPVTLPAFYENLRILGRPDNINSAKRHIRKHDAIFTAGAFQQRCTLLSESVDGGEGISATLALCESDLYAKARDLRLVDLFTALDAEFETFNLWEQYRALKVVFADGEVFPVATDVVDSEGKNVTMLNEPLEDDLNWKERRVTLNGESFDAPAGYGCTVFLYLHVVVRKAFELAGFQVEYNVFEVDKRLKFIVLLNNSADAIMEAYLKINGKVKIGYRVNYSQLVPDITIGDLIALLHDMFGAYVLYDKGTVKINLFEKNSDGEVALNLDRYARKEVKIIYPEPKSLSLALNTSIESAAPVEETLEKFRANFSAKVLDGYEDVAEPGFYYVKPLGKYYYNDGQTTIMRGTDCFRYSRTINDMDAEEMSCDNCFVPMVYVKDSGLYMPYIGARVHRNVDYNKDATFSQPVMMCYALWQGAGAGWGGSSYPYFEKGAPVLGYGIPPLNPEGLKEDYWNTYERMLVNGAPQLEVQLDMPLEVLRRMDTGAVYLFHGMHCFVRSLSYALSDKGISEVQAVLQVIPAYSDAVEIPDYSLAEKYTWAYVNTLPKIPVSEHLPQIGTVAEIVRTDGLDDYTLEDAPKSTPTGKGIISKRRSRYIIVKCTFFYLGQVMDIEQRTIVGEEYFISK